MNYIELINNFWELDEQWQFTCRQTRLYFYLVKTANRLGWLESWTHSDAKTAANVGVSQDSLKTAREKLIQAGLLAFRAGGRFQGDKNRYQILSPTPPRYLNPQPSQKTSPKPPQEPSAEPPQKLAPKTPPESSAKTTSKADPKADPKPTPKPTPLNKEKPKQNKTTIPPNPRGGNGAECEIVEDHDFGENDWVSKISEDDPGQLDHPVSKSPKNDPRAKERKKVAPKKESFSPGNPLPQDDFPLKTPQNYGPRGEETAFEIMDHYDPEANRAAPKTPQNYGPRGEETAFEIMDHYDPEANRAAPKSTQSHRPRGRGGRGLDLSFVAPDFRETVDRWLSYKAAKGQAYKSAQSLEAMYEKLLKCSGGSPTLAAEVIMEAMAKNYAGFFELKNTTINGQSHCKPAFASANERSYGSMQAAKRNWYNGISDAQREFEQGLAALGESLPDAAETKAGIALHPPGAGAVSDAQH